MSFRRVVHQRQQNVHSMLLEDYRAGRSQNLQLSDIVSHIMEFSRDRDGSKFIQRKLDEATENRKNLVFNEMKPHLLALMKDTFANFIMQKIIDVGSENHRMDIFAIIQLHFMELSLDRYGCRVVQKAIQRATQDQQIYILNSVRSRENMLRLIKNPNGNHVIQNCFRSMPVCCQVYSKRKMPLL